jgi:polyisoprenoid-binding protein YceI
MKLLCFAMVALCAYAPIAAAAVTPAPAWQVIPEKSRISFTAQQNNAPVQGNFSRYNAVIHFAPDNLAGSSVKAEIELASVVTDYEEIAKNLVEDDWFAVSKFPKAVFESKNFTHQEGKHYRAVGTLTLRDKVLPVTLDFTITHAEEATIGIEGETTLKRTAFGVGQGEWASTGAIGDEVKVKVVMEAKR